jgi:hypothetical protein
MSKFEADRTQSTILKYVCPIPAQLKYATHQIAWKKKPLVL